MSEIVERVAAAIASVMRTEGCEGTDESQAAHISEAARAAIEAMREPTKEMIDAAYWSALDEDAKGVWATMIAVALDDEPKIR